MAGRWRLLTDGVERRLDGAELVALFESGKVARFARVRRDPDGEWMAVERAVAVIRKQGLASSPPSSPVRTEPAAPDSAQRSHIRWGLGAVICALVVAGIGWGFRRSDRQPDPAAVPVEPPPSTTSASQPGRPATLEEATPSAASPPLVVNPPPPQPAAAPTIKQETAERGPPSQAPVETEIVAREPEMPLSAPYGSETEILERSRTGATDQEVAEFLAALEQEQSAERASGRVTEFIQQHRLSEKQSLLVGNAKRRFADRRKQGLVRLGAKWVSPADQRAAQAQARNLIEQAFALTDLGSIRSAEKLLEKASEIDGNTIEADLILGTLKGIVYLPTADAKKSESCFETVLKRSPDHLGALNNAAVAEIRQKHYSEALDHLERAAELVPRCAEVAQNLGRLSMLAGEDRIPMSSAERDRCARIYARIVTDGKGSPADPNRGYLLLPPYVSPGRRSEDRTRESDLVLVGQGTGFVVAPEMLLTNRHVVTMDDDAQSVADEVRVTVLKADRSTAVLRGTVKAVCPTDDLAIVHIPGLESAPIPLRQTPARLADEIAILGFPQAEQTGDDLKFVSGRIGAASAERLMFDCVANQGNSGGPVMSRQGDAVAVYNAVLTTGRDVMTQHGMGVPGPAASRFIQSEVGLLPPVKPVGGDWPGIVSRVRMSVFKLDVYYASSHPALLKTLVASTGVSRWLEDPSCPACSGRGAVVCPGGCFRGDVREVWTEHRTGTVLGRTVVIPQLMTNLTACQVCSGRGAVACPHCIKGVDPALRR